MLIIIQDRLFTPGSRVLVLEDDELVASGMISLLQGFDATVLHFYSAEDALLQANTLNADYYIVDNALSGALTGIEYLSLMQKKQSSPLQAVIITGETSSQFISDAANCPWPMLHKPVDFETIARTLCSL